jgi:uncharacterized protein YbjT (DUF2867 family)
LPQGAEGVVGNLADPPSLARVFQGVEQVMLITALHPDEAAHGQNAVRFARKAGVRKLVFLSVVLPADAIHIPHFASKLTIEKSIKESGLTFTILRANNFFQNDLAFREVMLQHGVYPQPLGSLGVTRVDTRDISDCAVKALSTSALDGKTVNLNGSTSLTGKDVARIWSKHLGTEVNYMGDDLSQWAEAAATTLPAWLVHDLRIMFDYFQKRGLKATPIEMREMEEALGRPPRHFEDFVRETTEDWKS